MKIPETKKDRERAAKKLEEVANDIENGAEFDMLNDHYMIEDAFRWAAKFLRGERLP